MSKLLDKMLNLVGWELAEEEIEENNEENGEKGRLSEETYSRISFNTNTNKKQHNHNKVVNIHSSSQLKVVVIQPQNIDDAQEISNHLKENKPDIVFSYSIKPVIYGSLAATSVGVKGIYSLIPGTGYIFSNKGFKAQLIKRYVSIMYKKALRCCTKVFFQNYDDMNDFINMKFITKEKCVKINGSGVDLEKYAVVKLPDEMTFLMTCRLLRDKGVIEYCKAAEIVKQKHSNVKFGLLGPYDDHPNSVKPSELQPFIEKGIIEYYGATDDVRPYLAKASVFVLPTYYNEGIPRTILEAMAMGRPIITTDWRGCREAVQDGVNGFLIKTRNVDSLVEKMNCFLYYQDYLEKMAEFSRRICEDKFDKNYVNHKIIKEINL